MKRGNSRFDFLFSNILSKSKRSQVTVFVIIAIVLIVIVGVVVFLAKKNIGSELDKEYFEQEHIKPDVNLIQSSILDCMEETSREALEIIGIQGGYYNMPPNSFDMGWYFIPYYYKEGVILNPSKSQVEDELGDYVDAYLKNCFDELFFEKYKLGYGSFLTSSSINRNDEVVFTIDAPVVIEREGRKIIFETKENSIVRDSYLYRILEVADYITKSHIDNPEMMCINCIADLAYSRNLYVDFLEFNGEIETLVIITENMTANEPYIFEFLNKYPKISG